MRNDLTKRDVPTAERFYVENPEWTYGKKLVVLASDYDKLAAHAHCLQTQLDQLYKERDEWERAARIARERNSGRITVVK